MRINLGNTPLFRGMTVPDIEEMLCCLRAAERTYKKGAVILPEGTPTEQLGVVLSGRVIIEMGDVWGNNSVLSSVGAGGIFAEAYACVPGEPLMVNVPAAYGHSPRGHQFTAGPYFLILSRHLNIKFMLSRCYTAGCQALHICRATSEVSIVSIRRPRIRTIYTC